MASGSIDFEYKPKGEFSNGWSRSLVFWGWEQEEIFKHRTPLNLFLTECYKLLEEELYEYVVEEDGEVVGSIIAFEDVDQHVGKCLSVRWALSKKPGCLAGGYRKLYKLAKYLDIPFIAYTQRTAPMTYTLRYKKVK